MSTQSTAVTGKLDKATFGAGCFWCTEAVFQRLEGVRSVVCGYSGGHLQNPSYAQVCTGSTGHAEVVQITFDPQVTSYQQLLEVFWRTHDSTMLNRQGADVGSQYRSVVFYHNDGQRQLAEQHKQALNQAQAFGAPSVTEITPAQTFYPAEEEHQQYYDRYPRQPYCVGVIRPKLNKFSKLFADKMTTQSQSVTTAKDDRRRGGSSDR